MFEQLQAWLHEQLTDNDVFAGVVGGSVIMTALYAMRDVPDWLWNLFLHQYTCTLTVNDDDETFYWLIEWLAHQPYAKKARRLILNSFYQSSDADLKWALTPGYGRHFMLFRKRLLVMERRMLERSGGGGGNRERKEQVQLRILGREQQWLADVVAEATEMRGRADYLEVFSYHGYWRRFDRRPRRAIESVVLPPDQVSRVIADIEKFLESEQWYIDRGIPYRRGYLFSGQTGTGKTSFVTALASHLGRPIYALNLGSIDDDDELFYALGSVPQQAIALIEDIDAAHAAKRRDRPKKKDDDDDGDAKGITMSGLLNAIDGVASKNGRILIMTTNHPEHLDPALIRPGRADLHEVIAPLEGPEAARLLLQFHPRATEVADIIANQMVTPVPGAELQQILMQDQSAAELVARLVPRRAS